MSPIEFRYFVTFVDDYSRTTWLYLMKNHSGLFSHFCAFCTEIHTQFHVSVQNGILHPTSFVDTPQYGVVERKNRHLLKTARALLFQMHVPKHFWADVIFVACFLINRMPPLVLNWDTPYHIIFPSKPLFPIEPRIFGCTCFV